MQGGYYEDKMWQRGSEGLPNCHVMSLFLLTKYQLLELAIISAELVPAQPGSLHYLTDVIKVSPARWPS